ncbi:MAG: LptA/OstA family protein [Armatimonadota bacterium]|nr:LptA/OstA family protein [Armatimonadota bacterium]MDR7449243.1 LptA/OstA family protein [Armatimonadota bacterium]MDR7459306.1 LptA/OstA family protein [Armatimonadota bacterium]MDR7478322.1 LptA/OstA family protein [Armatimonadota bacterium]MDR7487235.1 LptA/OstA family protein [Armatimonadota bacterium]
MTGHASRTQRAAPARPQGARLAVLGLVLALALVLAAGTVPAAAQPAAPPAGPPALDATGIVYAEYDAAARTWLLRGEPVVIRYGEARLAAPEVRYDERTGQAVATGGVEVRRGTLTVTAPRLVADVRARTVVADAGARLVEEREEGPAVLTAGHLTVDLRQETAQGREGVRLEAGPWRGEAPQGRFDRQRGLAVLTGGAVVRRGEDVLTAETITVDLNGRRAVATGRPRLHLAARPAAP